MGGFSFNVRDSATPKIRALMDRIDSTRLHRNMGRAVQNLCRNHLIGIAAARHRFPGRRIGLGRSGQTCDGNT